MFGDFISGGTNSIGVEEKVESSSKMSFFLQKSEKNHFLNYRDPKKLFSTSKKVWRSKIMFYTCFYIHILYIYHIHRTSADFRPARPIGRYVCSTPSYCNIEF